MKLLTIVTQILDYLDLRIKIPKINCMQRKRSHIKLIAPRANVTPFPVVVTQSDYDAVPVGGLYWFNGQLQKRYWRRKRDDADRSNQPCHGCNASCG